MALKKYQKNQYIENLFDFKNKNKEIEYANTKIYLNNKLKNSEIIISSIILKKIVNLSY